MMQDNNNLDNDIETMSEKELTAYFASLSSMESDQDLKAKEIKLQTESEHIIKPAVVKPVIQPANSFAFDLHGKTLLNSNIQPFMYSDVPYNVVFSNMVREISSMYLKFVLAFLILLFLVMIIL